MNIWKFGQKQYSGEESTFILDHTKYITTLFEENSEITTSTIVTTW